MKKRRAFAEAEGDCLEVAEFCGWEVLDEFVLLKELVEVVAGEDHVVVEFRVELGCEDAAGFIYPSFGNPIFGFEEEVEALP